MNALHRCFKLYHADEPNRIWLTDRKDVLQTILPVKGLFGRIKNELFYDKDFTEVNIQKFIGILNEYLIWYNEKRIKISLGNMSPWEYRQNLGLAT